MLLDWITDPHLDHLRDEDMLLDFFRKLNSRESGALLVTGDIAESRTIYDFLELLSGAYQKPVFFVLGNHDYYGAWMSETRERVRAVCAGVPSGILNWLPDAGPVFLEKRVAVVGHDGMYDAREGTAGLELLMSDLYFPKGIYDLADALNHSTRALLEKLEEVARESADCVQKSVEVAVKKGARKVLVLTHVPPFLEASYFRGKPSEPRFRPWYVNVTLGERLLEMSSRYPKVQFRVFAGHTHGRREVWMTDNLHVRVGPARYGRLPQFLELDTTEL